MRPTLNRGRGLLGAIRVNGTTTGMVRQGTSLLFDPAFLRKAGWDPSWADGSMEVHAYARYERGGTIRVDVCGWKYPTIYLFSSTGCYAYEAGFPRCPATAENMPPLLAPIRVQDGVAFCPWCGQTLRYARGSADWCNQCCTSDTGAVPGPGSPLWVELPENLMTSWESHGEVVSYEYWHG
jgi:hypothetical protein